MPPLKNLIKEVEVAIEEALRKDGFKWKGRYRILTAPLDDNSFGRLGLNRATFPHAGILVINPVVQVSNRMVNELIDHLADKDYAKIQPATAARPLGYLMPIKQYKDWKFMLGKDVQDTVEEILENFRKYGVPWMRKLLDLELLATAIEEFEPLEHFSYRVPVIHLMRNQKDLALTRASEFLEKYKKRDEERLKKGMKKSAMTGEYIAFLKKLEQWQPDGKGREACF